MTKTTQAERARLMRACEVEELKSDRYAEKALREIDIFYVLVPGLLADLEASEAQVTDLEERLLETQKVLGARASMSPDVIRVLASDIEKAWHRAIGLDILHD